jgi:O-antigen ligase
MNNAASSSVTVRAGGSAALRQTPASGLGAMGLAAFLLINAPSLKILLGNTPLLNAAATALTGGLVVLHGLLGGTWRLHRSLVVVSGLLWACILVATVPTLLGWRLTYPGFAAQSLRLVYLLAVFVLVAVMARRRDALIFLRMQIGWGALLSALYLAGIVGFGRGPVHYNTFTLPIGLSSISILTRFMQMEGTRWQWPVLVGLLVVNILGLLGLPGRSPFIFVIIITLAIGVLRRRSLLDKVKELGRGLVLLVLLISLGVLAVSYFEVEISTLLLLRLTSTLEGGEDSVRAEIYRESIRLIGEQPLGYGPGAYPFLSLGPYPHNFIIEIAFAGGILAALLMVAAVAWVLHITTRGYRRTNDPLMLQLMGVFFYLVCTFLVSYSLKDTYVMFAVMGLLVGLYYASEHRRSAVLA